LNIQIQIIKHWQIYSPLSVVITITGQARITINFPRLLTLTQKVKVRGVGGRKTTMSNIPLKQYWGLLYRYLRPQWKISLILAVLLLGNIALQLINPQIIRGFIDAAQAGATTELLVNAALLFLGLAVLQQFVTVTASYVSENVAWTATNALRVDLTRHCLGLDLSFHNARTPGEMIERVDGDINNLAQFFSRFVVELLGNALLLFGVLLMLWRENWLVGLGLSIFVTISMLIMLKYRNIAVPHWAAEREASANFYGFLEERLAGTEDIRANGAEAYVMRNFHGLIREMLRKSLKSAMVINVLININQFLFAVGTAAAFAIGTYLFQNQIVTIGAVYIIYHYTSMMNRPMDSIAHQVEELQRAGAGIVRIRELLAIENNIKDSVASANRYDQDSNYAFSFVSDQAFADRNRRDIPPALCFDRVTFGYDDSLLKKGADKKNGRNGKNGSETQKGDAHREQTKEIVLHDLSFTLEPGKVLGLLGRTGSGKTTLTRLLFRFYDPDEGSISISADHLPGLIDIRQLPLGTLRKQVGIITQNIQLFNASVRDNLTFFDHSIPDNTIEQVIIELGLQEWYRTLPHGLDSVLESGGSGLSAGEAQLLAFTRIFLTNPGLVVLDEASSRLDPATEALIEQAVDRLVAGRTAIIIAHRLGTVLRADQIMILDQGRIDEFGSRHDLANDSSSRFYQLLQSGLEEVLV
jgi:ABC-type multidrug transport system fused ATPase/permease subunit